MAKEFLANDYKTAASDWHLSSSRDTRFLYFLLGSMLTAVILGIIMSSIDVPELSQGQAKDIPARVAKFIEDKKRNEIPPPIPTLKPSPPPLPEPEQVTEKQIKKERKSREPLTEKQKEARERAEDSGLLALADELADLQQVDDIMDQLQSGFDQDLTGGGAAVGIAGGALDKGLGEGSGGIGRGEFGGPKVAQRQVALERSVPEENKLVKKKTLVAKKAAGERSAESVSRIFDRKKLSLYSLYNRERRKSPGLKGKLILKLTINPAGQVTAISIVSSELNNDKLEERIIQRVRRFDFGSQGKKPFTLEFPIEFLPS